MTVVQIIALLLAAVAGTAVVLTREPLHQAIVYGLYGFVLALVFLVLQAPDAALAQAVVSGMVVPLLVLVALAKIRQDAG